MKVEAGHSSSGSAAAQIMSSRQRQRLAPSQKGKIDLAGPETETQRQRHRDRDRNLHLKAAVNTSGAEKHHKHESQGPTVFSLSIYAAALTLQPNFTQLRGGGSNTYSCE